MPSNTDELLDFFKGKIKSKQPVFTGLSGFGEIENILDEFGMIMTYQPDFNRFMRNSHQFGLLCQDYTEPNTRMEIETKLREIGVLVMNVEVTMSRRLAPVHSLGRHYFPHGLRDAPTEVELMVTLFLPEDGQDNWWVDMSDNGVVTATHNGKTIMGIDPANMGENTKELYKFFDNKR